MSQSNNNALRAVSIAERTEQLQKDPAKSMATAADAMGSLSIDATHLTMSVTDPTAWATAMNNLGMVPVGLAGQQLVSDSLCVPGFDPSLSMMTGITPINPMMAGMGLLPPPPTQLPIVKEIIHCKSCTLFPQNPNLPPPSTRERPPGCKTVFVGGLPENSSDEIIQEVFEQCGDITAIRKSKKNFCHIRFAEEFMVDKAIYLSGYRMRLGSSTDKKDSGRLHVDFAQARDDFYEWECQQRLFAREERHRRKLEVDYFGPPSPPSIMHYSEHEATVLSEKLKDDNKFLEAISILLTWIDRGEVNRRTANQFYSMVQSANSHVRRLTNEKAAHEEKLEEAKEIYKTELLGILTQFEQIVAVFNASSRQKAWDHFSKAQRKNIDMWRKHCEELRNAQSEQLMGIRREEEMEMSDDDSSDIPSKKARVEESALAAQAYALKEENDSLRWQLDAYRNEVELLKQEKGHHARTEESLTKDQQLQFLQQAMQNMQQQLVAMQEELNNKKSELEKAKEEQTHANALVNVLKEQLKNTKEVADSNNHDYLTKENGTVTVAVLNHDEEKDSEKQRQVLKSEKEALLIGIISTFLNVHPFGANIEYLWSYLQQLDSRISANEIESLLMRLPQMFKQEFTGVGATLEKRWKFCAFEGIKTT
ncbi:ecto-NOX disulfide-thiol exchanger 1 isoform X1 [Bufo gargarizans]|uniref:ecto-NOX disulfide-thiol exchanger 1 isoform X1 n=1 Tax=Bufo gargarizans TaxID=30331 RepID=UPI001CF16DC9|nr:ecto-NOX disulfide-thiol exchanger 1 isoform X1 [Bufo gargarizans]XP_044139819.1 ecto-NOX disulfide-thiol exchanger 1 isoform X1 [Bufo gargarizans]XP_044139820.1 ecto-NOX disulfide-thiol exchanger 1 isoform X1 [Bufo gargarizans]XP_044139821.1 ecto-NOX disulfide-thiol exchanger 1 isoform X1 [Bufo gargarizans]XP_044139822.1 ecto-NOX disulfide-thiol exchanger 1 isoform X1 [Bufo gargarizans]